MTQPPARRGGHTDNQSRRIADMLPLSVSATNVCQLPIETYAAEPFVEGSRSERRRLDQLKEHPRQHELFGDTSDAELSELAENIRVHGLQHKVEILPEGTIIAGHQRVRAARLLGWNTIDVVVRNDLADAGDVAVENRMIDDNLMRRQLDPLSLARLYRRLKELERGAEYLELGYADQMDLRDRLAARLGGSLSGRTLDRYERLLDAPRVIQDAVSQGRLPMSKALSFLSLSERKRAEVAGRIAGGEEPRAVIDGSLGTTPARSPAFVYRRLLSSLDKAVGEILPHVADVVGASGYERDAVVELLTDAYGLIEELRHAEMQLSADAGPIEHAGD